MTDWMKIMQNKSLTDLKVGWLDEFPRKSARLELEHGCTIKSSWVFLNSQLSVLTGNVLGTTRDKTSMNHQSYENRSQIELRPEVIDTELKMFHSQVLEPLSSFYRFFFGQREKMLDIIQNFCLLGKWFSNIEGNSEKKLVVAFNVLLAVQYVFVLEVCLNTNQFPISNS